MNIYHVIKVKYLSPTENRGARVKLTSERFEKNSITIPYDYARNSAVDVASAWLNSHGYPVEGQGEGQGSTDYLLLGSDGNGFETLKK